MAIAGSEGDRSSTGTGTGIERRIGERRAHHRAMLLYGIQDPSRRSIRAVARAVGKSEGAIRGWRDRGEWIQRLASVGAGSDQAALDLYRATYMTDFGSTELPLVADRVAVPIGGTTLADPTARAIHEAAVASRTVVAGSVVAAEQATAAAIADRRRSIREDADRHIRLLDASLGLIARKLRADEVRVGVRDIPVLLECRDRLVGIAAGTLGAGAASTPESVRVKAARAAGTDLVAALLDDAEELVVILRALAASHALPTESRSESLRPLEG